MNTNLAEIFRLHAEWLKDDTQGERADLTGADLRGVNLSKANLTRANLIGANLTRANLTDANLTKANLTGANLRGAHLITTNLYKADLTYASLKGANLTGANLTGVNLIEVDLTDINGTNIITYSIGERQQLIYINGYIKIGREYHSLEEWVQKGRDIGIKNEYSKKDIDSYMKVIETLNNDGIPTYTLRKHL